MEYHCSDVARRISERGIDYFGEEIDYVLGYLSFLISINDENSKPF
jgi:cleavage stimulation factor subunit 3